MPLLYLYIISLTILMCLFKMFTVLMIKPKARLEMKLKVPAVLLILLLIICPTNVFAAPQDVDVNEAYGADGDPGAEGAFFSNDVTLSVGNNDDFGVTGTDSIWTTAGASTGTVNFKRNSTISNDVGAGAAIKAFNLNGGSSRTVQIGGDAFITTTSINGTGTFDLNGSLTGNVNFTADGGLELADTKNLTGTITTATDNDGTLTLEGTSTVSGQVGTNANKLKVVNAAANGAISTFSSDLYATTTNVTGTGTLDLNGALTGTTLDFGGDGTVALADTKNLTATVTTNTNSTGTFTVEGTSTITGQVGTAPKSLKAINGGIAGEVATFANNVFADTANVTGTGTLAFSQSFEGLLDFDADGIATLGNGGTLTGNITTSAGDGTGTFTVDDNGTVTGQVGAGGAALKKVNGGQSGGTSTFDSDVFATDVDVATGTLDLDGSLTGDLNFTGDGTTTLADTKNLTGTVTTATNNTGTLTLEGTSTVSGQVGADANRLKVVNAGANGDTATFSSDLFATTTNVTGTGTLDLNGSLTGTSLAFAADGLVTLADTKNLTAAITTATDSDGTLTIEGTSTITGQVGTGANKLKVINGGAAGEVATFANNVFADTANVTGTGTLAFSQSFEGLLDFDADGIATLGNGGTLTGNITTSAGDGTGTFTVDDNGTVTGQVGAGGAALKKVNGGQSGGTSTFDSDVFATDVDVATGTLDLDGSLTGDLNFTGDGTTTLADTKNLTGTVTTATNNTGTLTLEGTSTVSGQVGTNANRLKVVNAAANGDTATFSSDLYATTTNVTGTGILDLNGALTGTTLHFANDGTIQLANTKNITANITNTNTNEGTLTLEGAHTITGDIGSTGAGLKLLTVGNGDVSVTGDIKATTTNFAGDNKLTIADTKSITSAVTTSANNTGTLEFAGAGTITGSAGAGGAALKLITVGNGAVTAAADLVATTINFAGDNTLTIADTKNVTGAVTTSANNTGTLKFAGDSTMTGPVGVLGTVLKQVMLGNNDGSGDGKTVAFTDDIYATSFLFNDDGIATIADGKTVNSTITTTDDSEGTLTLLGSSTFTGDIATNANRLKALNANGAAGKTVQLDGNVFADTTSVNGTGTLDINGSLTGTTLNFGADGVVQLADTKNLTLNITNTNTNEGTLTLEGAHTITGDIGSTGAGLKLLTVGNGDVSVTGDIKATTTNFAGDNKLTIADTKSITSAVTTSANNTGTLEFAGAGTITGSAGAGGAALKLITVGNGAVTAAADLVATTINFAGDNTLTMADGNTVTGAVTTSANGTGDLKFAGDSTMTGDVGAVGATLRQVTLGSNDGSGDGKTVAFTGDIHATNFLFNDDVTATIADGKNINGTVAVTGNGEGTLTYLGASTTQSNLGAAGNALKAVNVNGGIVTLNHNIWATNTTVNAGGRLNMAANRNITGNVALAGTGILDIGLNQLNVTGTYGQAAGTTLEMAVNGAAQSGQVASGAAATVNAGSTVNVGVSGYVPDGTTYTVVDGTGGAGVAVPTITDNSFIISFNGISNGADLILQAVRANSYSNLADTPNNEAVAEALESAGADPASSNDMFYILTQIDQMTSAKEVNDALEQMLPDVSGAVIQQSFSTLNTFLSTVFQRLAFLRQGMEVGPAGFSSGDFLNGVGIWTQGFGHYSEQGDRGGITGYEAAVYGGALGVDKLITDAIRIGASFSYAYTNVNSRSGFGPNTNINTYQNTLYGTFEKDNFYVDLLGAFSYGQYETRRSIMFPGVNRRAKGEYDGFQFATRIETGYTIELKQLKSLQVTPRINLQYSHLYLDGYRETDAGALNLNVRHSNYDAMLMGLGSSFAYPVENKCGTFIPQVHAMWYYDFFGEGQQSTSTFNGGGSSFRANGIRPAKSSFNLGGQLTFLTKGSVRLSANYDMQVKENYWGHNYYLTARIDF